MTRHHPEQEEDEIYMANWEPAEAWRSGWYPNLRFGKVPYNAKGEALDPVVSRLRPGFLPRAVLQAKIESCRLENREWSAEQIRTYQTMLDTGRI